MKPVNLGNVFARGVRSIVTVSDATEDRGRAVRRAHFYAWPPPYDPNNWRARTHFNFGKRQRPAEKNFEFSSPDHRAEQPAGTHTHIPLSVATLLPVFWRWGAG